MTVDEWNTVFDEVSIEIAEMTAKQLIRERKDDPEKNWDLNEAFSAMALQ